MSTKNLPLIPLVPGEASPGAKMTSLSRRSRDVFGRKRGGSGVTGKPLTKHIITRWRSQLSLAGVPLR